MSACMSEKPNLLHICYALQGGGGSLSMGLLSSSIFRIPGLQDRPGVRQVPEGSGEQGKMEETGCKIVCGAPMTLTVKG